MSQCIGVQHGNKVTARRHAPGRYGSDPAVDAVEMIPSSVFGRACSKCLT